MVGDSLRIVGSFLLKHADGRKKIGKITIPPLYGIE